MSETQPLSPIAKALGRVPTGLYLVTTRDGDTPMGFVGSFVTQVGFEPPTVLVAVGHDRDALTAIRSAGRFAVSILDGESSGLMGAFFGGDGSPFDRVTHEDSPGGMPVFPEALAWLDCKVSGEHALRDHVVVFGEVCDAACVRDGDPTVHLRNNGLGY